jgi:AAA family ATPase
MDGVQELLGVTIVAATNRPEVIVSSSFSNLTSNPNDLLKDSALMRPGRLDRILYVGPSDQAGREEILRIKTRGMSVDNNTNLTELAKIVRLCFSSCHILVPRNHGTYFWHF